MLATEIIKILKDKKGMTFQEIAERLNLSTPVLYNRLSHTKNLGTKQLIEILNVIGYELAIVPKDHVYGENQYRIDNVKEYDSFSQVCSTCRNCGHYLSKREKVYNGCPYCFTPYTDEEKRMWKHEEEKKLEIEKIQEDDKKLSDMKKLMATTLENEEETDKNYENFDINEFLKDDD